MEKQANKENTEVERDLYYVYDTLTTPRLYWKI